MTPMSKACIAIGILNGILFLLSVLKEWRMTKKISLKGPKLFNAISAVFCILVGLI